ncbi:MAG: DUF4293 domain-containing protein [Muribaculaceae bacterium]|nr:DUF4293 domain-containing protein [Muribaculaceae bacterium]
MVIQRWQSIYLLLALFAMVLVFLRPFCYIEVVQGGDIVSAIRPIDYPIFLIVNILTTVLLFIDIFLFKNLRLQRMVAAICIMLLIASAITVGFILYNITGQCKIEWGGAPVGLTCALICTILARYRMGKDEETLRSYDRIR